MRCGRNTAPVLLDWLVGCFWFNGPFRQYFSLYRAVSQREGERGERIDESKNVQTTPTHTYCKRNRLLPYCYQNCRTALEVYPAPSHHPTNPSLIGARTCMRVYMHSAGLDAQSEWGVSKMLWKIVYMQKAYRS